jgi:small-conductance mechanosensitive channel
MAFMVAAGDADPMKEETPEAVAERSSRALSLLVAETRESRDTKALLWAALMTMLATAAFVAAVWLLARLRRSIHRRLETLVTSQARRVRAGDTELLAGDRIALLARRGADGLFGILVLVVAYHWLGFVLERFPYTRPWGEQLVVFLWGAFGTAGRAIAGAVPGLLFAVIIFLGARVLVNVLRTIFDRVEQGNLTLGWLDADTARPTRRITSAMIWLFALAFAYPYLPGSDTDAFKGISILAGLMLSLGASSVVGQGANGLILMYSRAFKRGDYVRIGDREGTVIEAGLFVTRIRTPAGKELTLSNSYVVGSVTENFSRGLPGPGVLLETGVTIGYDTPWRQVEAMLLEAARRTEHVAQEPRPTVDKTELSDFYVEYRLVARALPTGEVPRRRILSNLHANVLDLFNEHGVQIMSPHYEQDPQEPKVVARKDWHVDPVTERDSET